MDEAHRVGEAEAGVANPGRTSGVELDEHLLDERLVLVGALRLGRVADDGDSHGDTPR